jgi:hypothetical protein
MTDKKVTEPVEEIDTRVDAGRHVLSASEILSRDDRPVTEIPVPEWNGIVRTRPLTLVEQAEHSNVVHAPLKESETEHDRARTQILDYLFRVLVNEDGRPLFTFDDLEKLQRQSGPVLQWLFEETLKANGIDREANEDAEKN